VRYRREETTAKLWLGRGFYSKKDLNLSFGNGNHYIISSFFPKVEIIRDDK